MNNYTFKEINDLLNADEGAGYTLLFDKVNQSYKNWYGIWGSAGSDLLEALKDDIFQYGLHLDNFTVLKKSYIFDDVVYRITRLFVDALWNFSSVMKYNLYDTKLDELNKKIISIKTSVDSNSTNKFYENNNIKDADGNWNSPQFLNRSETSANNGSTEGNSEITGELAKYLKELQEVNNAIVVAKKRIINESINILTVPFNDDTDYWAMIPDIWTYD